MPSEPPVSIHVLTTRSAILATELRAVRHARARTASGADVHRLDNLMTTIAGSLQFAETPIAQAQPEVWARLLALADASLHQARALLVEASISEHHAPTVRAPSRHNPRSTGNG